MGRKDRRAIPKPTLPATPPGTRLYHAGSALAEAAALAAVVVTPLYFNPASQRVFEPEKLTWVVVLGLAAALGLAVRGLEGWLHHGFDRAKAPAMTRAQIAPATLLWLAIGLAALALVLGAAGSVLPAVSLWGSYRRGLGLAALLALIALFAATAMSCRGPDALARLRRASLLPVVPVAAYALLQRMGIDSVPWQVVGDHPAARAFGPMGNPILLGAYLAMVLPLGLVGLAQAWQDRTAPPAVRRVALAGHALVLALGGAALLASQSRGPLLGLMVGLGALATLWAAHLGRRRLALGLVAIGLALAVAAVVLGGINLPGLGRLGGVLDLSSRTAQERVLVWQALADLVEADPERAWRGYGLDTLMYVLPPYLPDELIRLTGDQTFDRAHNVVWEWWLAAGLPGLAALWALYAAAVAAGLWILGLWRGRRAGLMLLGSLVLGTALGGALPILAGAGPMVALGAPLGLVGGSLVFGAFAARPRPTAPSRSRADQTAVPAAPSAVTWYVLGSLAALMAHLVESALGLPTAPAEVLTWILLGTLAGLATSAWPQAEADAATWSAGLLDGLVLAALAFAPLLLPRSPTRSPEVGWAIWILPLVAWLAADLLTVPRGAPYRSRAVPRLAVLGAFLVLFLPLAGWPGGPVVAFGLVLIGAVAALAFGLSAARPVASGGEPWRWVVVTALVLVAGLAGWRLALAPALADTVLRAGLERAVMGERAAAAVLFAEAEALWPDQPGFATLIAARRRDDFLDPALSDSEREAAFQSAARILTRSLALAPDDAVALRLANLYRDRGDVLVDAGQRQAAWHEAEGHYLTARKLFPRSPSLLLEHARLLERLGRSAEAEGTYRQVTELQPPNVSAWAGLTRLAVMAGDWEGAANALRAGLDYRRDHPEEVERALSLATPLAGEEPAVRRARVIYLSALGQFADAHKALEALAGDGPADPRLADLAAWLDRQAPP